jgi:GNAT superfamily N-acetyltransferase
VEKSVTQFGTKVWLFRRESDDQLIGFGSLGRTRRRWPPPSGQYVNLPIIPQLAVDVKFHGQPANDPPRYSHQILGHLIAEAREMAHEVGSAVLLLYVHEQNARAMRLYEEFDFVADKTARSDNLVLMTHRLIA